MLSRFLVGIISIFTLELCVTLFLRVDRLETASDGIDRDHEDRLAAIVREEKDCEHRRNLLTTYRQEVVQAGDSARALLRLLLGFSRHLPAGVWISHMDVVGDRIEIHGRAQRDEDIAAFVRSDGVTAIVRRPKVESSSVTAEENDGALQFVVTGIVDRARNEANNTGMADGQS